MGGSGGGLRKKVTKKSKNGTGASDHIELGNAKSRRDKLIECFQKRRQRRIGDLSNEELLRFNRKTYQPNIPTKEPTNKTKPFNQQRNVTKNSPKKDSLSKYLKPTGQFGSRQVHTHALYNLVCVKHTYTNVRSTC